MGAVRALRQVWRALFNVAADDLPDEWFCEMNADVAHASCDAPEQSWGGDAAAAEADAADATAAAPPPTPAEADAAEDAATAATPPPPSIPCCRCRG